MRTVTVGDRINGIAGQYGYRAEVVWEHQGGVVEESSALFLHNTYGGPVVVIAGGAQVFIDREVVERCGGRLDPSFIYRFYGHEPTLCSA